MNKSTQISTQLEPSDEIIEIANHELICYEKRLDLLEKKIGFSNRLKQLVCKTTTLSDWVDMGGKPYLQCHGAEKIAHVFGVGWGQMEEELETMPDGHFIYTYKMIFTHENRELQVIGTRSSNTPLFSRSGGRDIPPELIDKANIKKSAYTNCVCNGIKRILGIRNMTWDEIRGNTLEIGEMSSVSYGERKDNNRYNNNSNTSGNPNLISEKQLNYARRLCKDVGLNKDKLEEFLAEKAFSVKADAIAEMSKTEAKVFIESLLKLKESND